MNVELTFKTIESVLALHNFGNSHIVVVDNASTNDSGKLLEQTYKDMKQVHIVLAESNVGFSDGNNLGFQYMKENFSADFVIVINNDILFPQKDFIDKLNALYLESPFWVAGPDVYVPHRDYHSSPIYEHLLSTEEVNILLKKIEWEKHQLVRKKSLYVLKLYLRDCFRENALINVAIKLNRFIRGQKKNYKKRVENVVLQGSCLIFDKRYCEKNEKLFFPTTFMYGEEILLTLRCLKNNWEIKYFPELFVWHSCGGSLQFRKLSYKEYCKKKMIELGRCQEAYTIYIEQLQK